MRILFLSPFVLTVEERPDPTHHLTHMARKHEVILAALYRRPSELERFEPLRQWARAIYPIQMSTPASIVSCLARAPTAWPLYVAYFYKKSICREIQRIAAAHSVDLVHAYTLRMAPYAAAVPSVARACDASDVLTTRYRRYYEESSRWSPSRILDYEEWFKLRRFEPRLLEQIGFAACISEPEAAEMRDLAPKTQVHVIPPGVDCDYFRPLANVARRLSLVFVGRLSYRPNAEAVLRIATRILPRVKADCPDATFVAVGSDPPPDVLRLRRHDGVEVTGRVPDVRPYLARGAVSVAPMSLGGGLRLKVLEALAMETPVVTTRLGAKGLQVEDGLNITLAEDDDAAIARACVQLLASPAERHRRGIAGREFVLRGYSLARQAEALGSFHAAAVAGAVDKTS